MTKSQHVYEVRPRKDKRGVNLISDALPFSRLWYGEPNAISNAIGYAEHRSRSHDAVIRVYDAAGPSSRRTSRPCQKGVERITYCSERNQRKAMEVWASLTSWPPWNVPILIRSKPVRLIKPKTAYCCSGVAILSSCPALR